MSLDLALSIARSGLSAVSRNLGQASQNISNAETPGYTRKTVPQRAITYNDAPGGVRTADVTRNVDAALVTRIDQSRSEAAGADLRARLLQRIDDAQGTPAEGTTLADGIGALENAFTALRGSPDDAGLQRAALDAATELARRFQSLSDAVGSARAEAQSAIIAGVDDANAAIRDIADLTQRLKSGVAGQEAEIEDGRDAAIGRLAETLEVRAVRQPGGDILLIGRNGVILPADPGQRDPLATTDAAVAPQTYFGSGGTLPGVTLGGIDVTTQLTGGRLAEAIELRDRTLPRIQAELDVAAATLAQRLQSQGLRLFTDTDGSVPVAGAAYAGGQALGFASRITVDTGLAANPAGLRDGNTTVIGDPQGATNFTPNPAGGPAGFTTLLDRVLDYGFGAQAAAGVGWPGIPSTGLGPDGSLSSPFLPPATARDYASRITSLYAADLANANAARDTAETLQTSLSSRFATESGVDVDAELARMVALQNAYAANARVLSTVQNAWDALLGAVR